jgi:hypothetical protein
MAAGVGVGGGVALWRVIAAAEVPTFEADPQVKPRLSCSQAILAAIDRFRELCDLDVGVVPAEDHVIRECRPNPDAGIARTCDM